MLLSVHNNIMYNHRIIESNIEIIISSYTNIIGGLGELVRLVRPPVTGRSASFRLRFCFVCAVRAVRAVEAKLRGCACADRCPYRWASWELGSTLSAALGVDLLCAATWALKRIAVFFCLSFL